MQIDCYGFEATSQWFKRRTLEPYMFMHVDDVLYLRYSAAEVGPVHRIDRGTNGELRTMWAYGAWGNAPDLSYVPINERCPRRQRRPSTIKQVYFMGLGVLRQR